VSWTTIRTTREELYAAVWAEPVERVARRFGLSDVGLAKLCGRHSVPVPPRGYWARKAVGKADPIPPLPSDSSGAVPIVVEKWTEPEGPSIPAEVQQLLDHEQQPDAQIRVVAGRPKHSLTIAAGAALRATAPNERGIVRTAVPLLDMRIGRASIPRALAIADAVLSAFERRGYRVETPRDSHPRVQVFGRWFGFRVEERSSRVPNPTSAQLRRAKRFRPWDPNVKVLEPTGILHVFATEGFDTRMWDIRGWSDTRRQRVDDRLNDVIAAIIERAQYRRDQDAAEARRAERAAVRARLHAAHERRVKHLMTASASYRDFRALSALLRAAERHTSQHPLTARHRRWLRWAHLFVSAANPVLSLIDDKSGKEAN
jgi:hypothetical protein